MATTVEQTEKRQSQPTAAPQDPVPLMRRFSPRTLLTVGGVVLVAGLVVWGIVVSGKRKQEFAARALDQARSVAESGNLALASSSLQQVIQTYPGTEAAQEAVLTLNQVRLVNGQNELAAVNLREFLNTKHDARYVAAANAMLGTALENAREPAQAGAAYEKASDASDTDYLKAEYLVDAGRAYRDAGKTTDAEAAYRQVVNKYDKTPSLTEAQVRLAELTDGKL